MQLCGSLSILWHCPLLLLEVCDFYITIPERFSPSSASPGTGGASSPGPWYIPSLIFCPRPHLILSVSRTCFAICLIWCSLHLEKSLLLNKFYLPVSCPWINLTCSVGINSVSSSRKTSPEPPDLGTCGSCPSRPCSLPTLLSCSHLWVHHLLACVYTWWGALDTGACAVCCFLRVQHRVGAWMCSQGERLCVPRLGPPHDAVSFGDDGGTSQVAGSWVTWGCWVLREPATGFVSGGFGLRALLQETVCCYLAGDVPAEVFRTVVGPWARVISCSWPPPLPCLHAHTQTHTHTHTHRGCGEVFCGRRRGCHLSANCPLLLALAEGEDQPRGSVCPGGGDLGPQAACWAGWGLQSALPHGAGTPPPPPWGPCGLAVITVQGRCVPVYVWGCAHPCRASFTV